MAALNFPFSASGGRRLPTSGEMSGGFSCGPADQELFNFLIWWFSGQIDSAIEGAGLTTDDSDLAQLLKSIRSQRMNWVAAAQVAGTADAITLAFDPVFSSLSTLVGVPLRFLAEAANTGAVTIAVDGLSATPLTSLDGSALVANDITNGMMVYAIYDGTAFRLMTGKSSAALSAEIAVAASIPGRTQVFTSSGTFTVPDDVTQVEVICIGGGGGGGASGDGSGGGVSGNSGAGGGGGGYTYKRISGLTPGDSITVTRGAGGSAAASAAGGNGGTSSFGAHCSATGGAGGAFGTGTESAGGTGGTGSGGDINVAGGNGGSSGTNSASTPTQSQILNIFNKGGIAAGGFATPTFGGTGDVGRGFGCGGGGASGGSGVAGGAGAAGVVIVRW